MVNKLREPSTPSAWDIRIRKFKEKLELVDKEYEKRREEVLEEIKKRLAELKIDLENLPEINFYNLCSIKGIEGFLSADLKDKKVKNLEDIIEADNRLTWLFREYLRLTTEALQKMES